MQLPGFRICRRHPIGFRERINVSVYFSVRGCEGIGILFKKLSRVKSPVVFNYRGKLHTAYRKQGSDDDAMYPGNLEKIKGGNA
jgi:hypothetical protein